MSKIVELLKLKAAKGDVGIEIECEGERLRAVDNDVWTSENDGSLRGRFPDTACEYILRRPIVVGAVRDALNGLVDELKGAKFNFSYRTSVHVHMNVQQLTFPQLLNAMYTYYLLEEPFMNFCGKKRKGNNFCLRLADAEGVLEWVMQLFELGPEMLGYIPNDNARYAAMNLEAIRKYGSLEFRGMEGNINVDRIDTWCKVLVFMRDWAAAFKNPKEIYETYMHIGPNEFMAAAMGPYVEKFKYARAKQDIEMSFSISIDLPFAYKEPQEVKKGLKYWEYCPGSIVEYGTAVKINQNGGYVIAAPGQKGRYIVTNQAPQPEPRVRAPQEVIIEDFGQPVGGDL